MHWAWAHAVDHLYVAAISTNGDEVRDTGPHGGPPPGFLALLLHLIRARLAFLLLVGFC